MAGAAVAHSADQSLTFEAASIKPGASTDRRAFTFRGGPGTAAPGYIYATSASLSGLIQRAYGVKSYEFVYPPWMDDARFDLTVKLPDGASKDDAAAMLRNLLLERFRLKARRESRTVPIYSLRTANGGLRIAARKNDPEGFPDVTPEMLARGVVRMFVGDKARLIVDEQPLDRVADVLSLSAGRPVLDRTGVSDPISFTLRWTTADDLSLFGALEEQLGLKLEPGRETIQVLVVDSADRTPAAN
jgi:uncharacterized protein (TIGR03435 family)